jgi:hypothetical protein
MTNLTNLSRYLPSRTRVIVSALVLLAVALIAASPASAAFHFAEVGAGLNQPPTQNPDGSFKLNADGTFVPPLFERQAGGHPDIRVTLRMETTSKGGPVESIHDALVDLPPGFVGDPTAIPTCAQVDLINVSGFGANCPVSSQIGVAEAETAMEGGGKSSYKVGVYNVAHGSTVPALFGFNTAGVVTTITPKVRPGDYGITSGSFATPQAQQVIYVRLTLWGVPAASVHDNLRMTRGGLFIFGPFNSPSFIRHPAETPEVPFLSAPTSCTSSPQAMTVRADSWENKGIFDVRPLTADESGTPFVFDGCDRLAFKPTAEVRPLSHVADSPTGLAVNLTVPQAENPGELAVSHVRDVTMAFPEGMAVNASSAAGLGSCSPGEIGLGSNDAPSCPSSSKLGTVSIETPLLDETLEGGVYLAKQNDNPFNSLLALYIAVKGPGFWLKLPGKIATDQATGRLTATFANNPQLPFEHLHLELPGGAYAALTTPRACGSYNFQTDLTPWSGQAPVTVTSQYQVNEGCNSGGFSPELEAGTVDPTAGSYSPFLLRVTRSDGESNLAGLRATLPEGLLAKLGGVTLCSDAQAATGECPAASQVGDVTVGAGSGSSPIYVPEAGKAPTAAYLAGPYKGAPYSMVVKVPAQAGPFDLGTVSVRNALRVDPVTTQVTAVSDPLPQILQGIPIAYRDVRVEVNRPQFTINPTNCGAAKVTATFSSSSGQTADASNPFSASSCDELGFGPSLSIAYKGSTKRTGNPALTAVLKAPKGDANIAATTVILPKSAFIDNAHISTPCTRVQFDAGQCPPSSVLGTATATSPLLDRPLSGPVYFRSNGGARELPDLVADLSGPIHVTVTGFIDSVKTGKESSRVRTRFLGIPDAPVSKFVLRMKGAKKGLIENSANLCATPQKASVRMTGQNGKRHNFAQTVKTGCKKPKKKK